MKRIILAIIATFLIGANQLLFAQSEGFGLGVILGQPTGISLKTWTGKKTAIDGAIAWDFRESGYLHIHADYLRHSFKLLEVNQGQLPVYYGIGAKLVLKDNPILGVRIPLGINYIFGDAPLDLFAEFVPQLLLIPDTEFDFGGGIGIRYWFK